ncbi:MAG: transcriptional regulator/antitoxin, MazE [Coriobacteriia bacterium]|nr:transcriptional regulator/antitoxin, MazE [Coriobacteriia bacterium]
MLTKITKWGNSQGLRVSKELLADAGIEVGTSVDVSVSDGTLVVVPARRVRGALDLRELVARIPEDHRPEESDWGPAVGGEVW